MESIASALLGAWPTVHSPFSGNRAVRFCKTERNFEVIKVTPLVAKSRPTFHRCLNVSCTWQLTPFKRPGSLFSCIVQHPVESLFCETLVYSMTLDAWRQCQHLRESIHKPVLTSGETIPMFRTSLFCLV